MKPGSTVVCINDQFSEEARECLCVFPKQGVTYTVRAIIPDPRGKFPAGIVLDGLYNPMGWVQCEKGLVLLEYSYRAARFVSQTGKEEFWEEPHFQTEDLALPFNEN